MSEAAGAPDSPAPFGLERWAAALILAGITMAAGAFVLFEGRGNTFSSDEQSLLLSTTDLDPETLALPHHGSLMALTRGVLYGVTSLFGTDSYWLLRVIGYAGVVACAWLVYVFARRRIGPLLALAPAVVLLAFGTSWDVLFVPLNGTFWAWASAAGIAALLALERNDRTGDLLATALLLLSVISGSIGLAFVAGAAVYVLLGPGWTRRSWVIALPVAAYAGWWLWMDASEQSIAKSENAFLVPDYAVNSLGNAWAAIFGLNVSVGDRAALDVTPVFNYDWSPLLAAIAVWALGIRLWLGSVPRSLWALLGALVAFWTLAGLVSSTPELRTPESSRYVFGAAALVLLATVDAVRGLRPPRAVVAAVFVAVAISLPANIFHLTDGRTYLSQLATHMKAQLRMLELAGDNADPTYVPGIETPDVSPIEVILSAGDYLRTVDRVGSWAYSIDEVLEQGDDVRRGADVVLARALRLGLAPTTDTSALRDCRTFEPDRRGVFEASLPVGGAGIRAVAGAPTVELKRFADTFAVPLGTIAPGTPTLLRIPPDAGPSDWIASIRSPAAVEVCALSQARAAS